MSGKDANPIAVGKIRLDVPKLAELKTRVKSPVVSIANLSWSLEVMSYLDTSNIKQFSIYAYCNDDKKSPHWSCEASVIFRLLSLKVDIRKPIDERRVDTYSAKYNNWGYSSFIAWDEVLDPEKGFIRQEDGGVVVEAMVIVRKVIGMPVSTLCDFTAPLPNLTDVALIIEEKPLHVCKAYLAYHSPVFDSMFSMECFEDSKKEIPLENVKYDEFVELLHVIFPSHKPVTVATVESLLRLADRFNMQFVLHSCEEFLRGPDCEEIPLAKKLIWSDKYRLASLLSVCLHALKTLDDVKLLKATKEYGDLTDKTKAALGERIHELTMS